MTIDEDATTLVAKPFLCSVHMVEIYRLKNGPDHVYLHTNLPNPKAPYQGCLALHLMCDRGTGYDWAVANFPEVEFHLYDHSVGSTSVSAKNPLRISQSAFEIATYPAAI